MHDKTMEAESNHGGSLGLIRACAVLHHQHLGQSHTGLAGEDHRIQSFLAATLRLWLLLSPQQQENGKICSTCFTDHAHCLISAVLYGHGVHYGGDSNQPFKVGSNPLGEQSARGLGRPASPVSAAFWEQAFLRNLSMQTGSWWPTCLQ